MEIILGSNSIQSSLLNLRKNNPFYCLAPGNKIFIIKISGDTGINADRTGNPFKKMSRLSILYAGFITFDSKKKYRDTEKGIIELYHLHKENIHNYLDGRFSLSIWDRNNDKLILINDVLGYRTFYYFFDNRRFFFSSCMKTLIKHLCSCLEYDEISLECFLDIGFIPGNRTIFKRIRKLSPGEMLIYENKKIRIKTKEIIDIKKTKKHTENYYINGLNNCLSQAIKGPEAKKATIFFTGGIDSSLIASILKNRGIKQIQTVCGGYKNYSGHILENARKTAASLSFKHHNIVIDFKSMLETLSQVIKYMDEPIYHMDITAAHFILESMKDSSDLFFSGMGCDNLFETDLYLLSNFKNKLSHLNTNLRIPSSCDIEKLILIKLKTKMNSSLFIHEKLTASLNSPKIIFPFLNQKTAEFILNTPRNIRNKKNVSKYLLRMVAKKFLPESICLKKRETTSFPREWIKALSIYYKKNILNNQFFKEKLNKNYSCNKHSLLLKMAIFTLWRESLKENENIAMHPKD